MNVRYLASALLLAAAVAAPADILFNDYGPGGTYDTVQDDNWAVDVDQWIAVPFTITDTYILDTVDFSLVFSSPYGTLDVSIYSNEYVWGPQPGDPLTTWTLDDLQDGTYSLSGHDITLSPGTYYLALTTEDAGTAWSWNSIGDNSLFYFNEEQSGWQTYNSILPAMMVTGSPAYSSTPGPSAILPFALGALAAARKRAKA